MDYCNAAEYFASQQHHGARELAFGGDRGFVEMEYMRQPPHIILNRENYKFLFSCHEQMYNVLILDRYRLIAADVVKGKNNGYTFVFIIKINL